MRIHALILTTLIGCDGKDDSGDPQGGSYDTCYGSPMVPSPFSFSEELSSEQIASLLNFWNVEDASTVTCEQACEWYINSEEYSSLNSVDTCTHSIDTDAKLGTLECSGESTYYCEGRRPLGHVEEAAEHTLGGFLAHCAHLEAASVIAFEQLARQLSELGAPEALQRRCRQAAEEERRHADTIGALARQNGSGVPPALHQPVSEDIEAIALQNAVEGCVSETWAALVAGWKARHATDPALRAAYARIAIDEMRHAQLAWDLHTWLLSRLSADAQTRVESARQAAIDALPALAHRQARRMPPELGMPSPRRAAAMASQFGQRLRAA